MEKHNKKGREDLVRKYFITPPKKPGYFGNYLFMVIAAGIMAYPFLMPYSDPDTRKIVLVFGIVIFIITLARYFTKKNRYKAAYNKAEPKASDEQMDIWLNEGKEMILKTARERLDIDHDDISRDPLMIDGPPASEKYSMRPGKDKILRFKTHDIFLIFLTKHNIAIFQCIYNLEFDEILEDKTKEFPYKDITNLETETSTDTFYYQNDNKTKIEGIKSFSLFTSGSNKISINYFFIKNITDTDGYTFPPSDDENTIKAIRKRLKEYKDQISEGQQNNN